jgi:glutathione S-transferase
VTAQGMDHGKGRYTLYGSELSYYSGKTRSHLLHKGIPFVEQCPSAWQYLVAFPRRVGAAVVPVVRTPEGEWLADSSVIFDVLEQHFPAVPAVPETPVLRFAAYLFELWGDEFLLPLAMHTRWSRPEHRPCFVRQVGSEMLPGWPKFMQDRVGNRIANTMSGFRPTAGFGPEMAGVLDRFGQIQLDALDTHFAAHKFLLGNRPSLGDYGLIGPLYAHVGRDHLSKRDLIDTRPNLAAWIARMFQPETSAGGEFFADDRLPDTLMPALRSIFDEMIPFIAACAEAVGKTPVVPAGTRTPPRFLGEVTYPMAGGFHTRKAVSYVVWMAQRLLGIFAAMPAADQQQVRDWLAGVGGEAVLELDLPRVERVGLAAAHVA